MGSINTRKHDSDTVIVGNGTLDLYLAPEFTNRLREACESVGNVTVDFSAVEFIDTAIEASLARSAVNMKNKNRRLKVLVAEGSQPSKALKILGFDTILDIEIAVAE